MRKIHGWTLVELITILSLICLVTTLGIAPLTQSLQQHNQSIALKTLLHLAYYARTQAIKHNSYVTLCPSDNLRRCSGAWNKTVMVFSDYNKNETIDQTDKLFRTYTFNKNTPCISWNLRKRQYLQFKPNGASNGTAGHFKFCENVFTTVKRKIVVSFNGRSSLKTL